jgi:ATP-binding cassette subfamily B (MDR/TAP) protein 1
VGSILVPQINTSREIAAQLIRLSKLPQDGSHEHLGSLTTVDLPDPDRPTSAVQELRGIEIETFFNTIVFGRVSVV